MKKKTSELLRQQAGNQLAVPVRRIDYTAPVEVTCTDHGPAGLKPPLVTGNENLRQSTREAAAARTRYDELFDFTPVGLFTLDVNKRILEINRAGCQLLKIDGTTATQKRFTTFLSDGSRRQFHEFLNQLWNSVQHEPLHVTMKDSERSLIPTRLQARPSEDGKLYIAVIDMTPYRQAEAELKRYGERLEQLVRERTRILVQNEDHYHSLIDNLEDMVYSLDGKGRHTFINRAIREAFGLPGEEIIGKGIRDLGFPDDITRKWNSFQRQALTGKTVTGEIHMPMRDGREHLYEIRLNPLRDDTGKIIGCTGVNHDITEIRQARESLRQLSIRLLETQEKERRAIGETLHDELGASLTMLNLSLHQLKKCLSPEIDAAVKEIEDIVREVIEQVRSLSHSLRPSVLDQFGILEALQWHFQRFEAKTGFSVSFSHSGIEDRLPSEIENVIYRIVQEALTNAARHSGVNSINVVLCFENDVCTICMEDGGKGFDPLHIDSEGSGITGMQDLASLIGGELIVDSSPGFGTLVTCKIPVPPVSKTLHPRSTNRADVA